ncbi:hypothetical protein Taro_030853, partial [Colocasia esculenta]|nr:hypothetical protein [Colocasia esculenta]
LATRLPQIKPFRCVLLSYVFYGKPSHHLRQLPSLLFAIAIDPLDLAHLPPSSISAAAPVLLLPLRSPSRRRDRENTTRVMMDNAYNNGSPSSPSPKQRPRPINCFSQCFRGVDGIELDAAGDAFTSSPVQSPSSWPLSRVVHCRPELKGRHRVGKHRRSPAVGFGYDPLSYSRNFDDGPVFDGDGEIPRAEFRYRSFSSRLPSSPLQGAPGAGADELSCNRGSWD